MISFYVLVTSLDIVLVKLLFLCVDLKLFDFTLQEKSILPTAKIRR